MSDLNLGNIAKFTGGGALTGAGIAALLTYIRDTKKNVSEMQEDTSLDDDVLYIKGKKKTKKASSGLDNFTSTVVDNPVPDSSLQKALSLIGAVGGGLAGYKGISSLYSAIKKRQLQEELDNAQVAYMSQLTNKRDKERNKYASTSSTAGAAALTGLLTLALASGVISYKTLDKYFPKRKAQPTPGGKPISMMPEKIKVLGRRNKVVGEVDTDGEQNDADKIEGLIRTTIADQETSKQAGFDDLLAAVATGRTAEIKDNLQYGIDHTFDMVKGAAKTEISDKQLNLAIGVVARDPMLKEAFAPLFAAEFANMSPGIFDAVSAMSDRERDAFEKIAAGFAADYRQKFFPEQEPLFEKGAAALMDGFNFLSNVEGTIDEGTSFMSSGEDSEDPEEQTDEESNKETDTDMVDGFFDKGMDKPKQ